MANSILNSCNTCGKSIEAWSDGNPYYLGRNGKKKYAYHPDHEELAKCIGNDSPYLCIKCSKEFKVDSQNPLMECPECESGDIEPTTALDGRKCPFCNNGTFKLNTNYFCIS